MGMNGQTALVTGASSGIGSSLVNALAAEGCRVLATGRREAALEALSASSPGEVRWFACELDTERGRGEFLDWVRANTESLDFLFNNAGIQQNIKIEPELCLADVERELAINLIAPIMLTANLVPLLAAGSHARVVNTSSGLALAPKAAAPIYCASKAALSNFSLTLRWQLEPLGIGVVDVITPLVKTPMTEGRNQDAIEPDVFAQRLLRALRDGKATDVYIEKTKLLRMLMRLAPRRARGLLRDA